MNRIDIKFIDNQSFTDAKIISMVLNEKKKSVLIELEGGWIAKGDKTIFLSKSEISIFDWYKLDIFLEEEIAFRYIKDHPDTNIILESICEIKINANEIILRGYGKGVSGVWAEWKFLNPKVEVTGYE